MRPASSAPRLVVAVDGPSGAGKSTVCRAVATRLGLRYLDTGAMYRAVAWQVLAAGVDPENAAAVAALVVSVAVEIGTDPASSAVSVGGRDVAADIRGPAVCAAVSPVSAVPQVRTLLVAAQRQLIGEGGIVVEGRDIGTVVSPEAAVKIFLTASSTARAQRRARQRPEPGDVALVQQAIDRRDRIDSSRLASPLVRAADAIELDTTALTQQEVVEAVLDRCRLALDPSYADSLAPAPRP